MEEADLKEEKGIISDEKMEILLKQKELVHCAYNPLQYKEKYWHPIVNYFIMPVFALANAGVVLKGSFFDVAVEPNICRNLFWVSFW
jgi:NhaA family Na+:H+ antiporter